MPEGFDYTTALLDNWALGEPVENLAAQTSGQLMDPTMLPHAPDLRGPTMLDVAGPVVDYPEQAIQAPETTYPIAGLSTEQKQLYNQLDTSNLIDPNNACKD